MSEVTSVKPGKGGLKQSPNDDGLDMKTLFVRSIPFDANDEEFADFFSQFAPIKHSVIVKDSEKQSRGFGFVSFAVEDDTKEALAQARKAKFKNRLLRIDIAKRRERSKRNEPRQESEHKSYKESNEEELMKGKPKLIIRNMPWSCRDAAVLKKLFSRFGTVVEAKIPKKSGGKLCGFAFVTMKKLSACKRAIEEGKDMKIDGRQVAIDFAIQKNKWEEHKKVQEPQDQESEDADNADDGDGDVDIDNGEKEEKDDLENSDDGEESSQQGESEDEVELNSDEEISDEEVEEPQPRQKKNKQESFSIFVRNVPYDATQESLESHFSKFGPVKYALPVLDKETGLAKGTAFVAFKTEEAFSECVDNAPSAASTSLLISDDVLPQYVYEGRILSITPSLDRESANRMAEKNASKRKENFGKAPGEKDRRNLYLLNEGRITEGSKLAELLSQADMEVREKSYKLRVEQLKKNPSLHISFTRLAVRNLPRAMNEKALKAMARHAVVQFATEVKDGKRHALSKEEIVRSTKEKYKFMSEEEIEAQKKRDKKQGLVKQSKIIMEVKGTAIGRSRGYGFVEYRDHKAALMGLRWLNAHEVTRQEILEGLTDEEKKNLDADAFKKRRLCVEFAIENANVVKRRRENIRQSREPYKRGREGDFDNEQAKKQKIDEAPRRDATNPEEKKGDKDGMSNDIKRLIGFKRRKRQSRK